MASSPFVLAAVGDALLLHPIAAQMTDAASAGVLRLLATAEVSIANCEFSAFDPAVVDAVPQAESGGLWLNAGPDGVADLRALGFTMVSRANNHAMDFGALGMAETDRLLDLHGIAHAGTGRDLGAAREPAHLTTRAGRIALISATCTFPSLSRAAYARSDMRGRPGVNHIRAHLVRIVDPVTFQSLRAVLDLARQRGSYFGRFTADADNIRFLSTHVQRGEMCEERYMLNERDVEANLAQVRMARERADYVSFALHTHEPDNHSVVIPRDIRNLTHRIVEAGADVVIAHGPHCIKAVEIHAGKPILHGLANFICHAPKATRQPADAYENDGLDPLRSTIDDLFAPGGKWANLVAVPAWWDSMIARVAFEDGRPHRVELHPVDLCQHAAGSQRGTPKLADAQTATRMLHHVAALSSPLGTTIDVVDRTGIVSCARSSADFVDESVTDAVVDS